MIGMVEEVIRVPGEHRAEFIHSEEIQDRRDV